MGGLSRKPIPPGTDDEIVRALARSSSPSSSHVRHFQHAGKSYIAYEGGVPAFKPGTLVATGYAVSVVADGHHPTREALEQQTATAEILQVSAVSRQDLDWPTMPTACP